MRVMVAVRGRALGRVRRASQFLTWDRVAIAACSTSLQRLSRLTARRRMQADLRGRAQGRVSMARHLGKPAPLAQDRRLRLSLQGRNGPASNNIGDLNGSEFQYAPYAR